MITKTLNSVFGKLICNIANPITVVVELPRETPATVSGLKIRFKLTFIKDDNLWNSKNPIITRADTIGDLSKSIKDTIIRKVLETWIRFYEDNPIIKCEIECAAIQNSIHEQQDNVINRLKDIENCETELAKSRAAIPNLYVELEAVRLKYFPKKSA